MEWIALAAVIYLGFAGLNFWTVWADEKDQGPVTRDSLKFIVGIAIMGPFAAGPIMPLFLGSWFGNRTRPPR
jgi:hypothetical protein